MKKTREQVERLKEQWRNDGTWDIEETDGYEDYHDELLIFRLDHENRYLSEQLREYQTFFRMFHKLIGIKND